MEKFKNKLKDHGGFTLIEMLIVVAIIAILIAIGIPMVNAALEKAREATDSANERAALGLAMVEVMTDNKLGGTPIGDDPVYAIYKIDKGSKQGALQTGTTTEPTTSDAVPYGKGTALGDNSTPHVGEVVYVCYDPTKTAADQQFTFDWVTATGT